MVSVSILPGRFSQRYEAMLIGSLFNVMSLELRGFDVMAMLDKEFDKFPMFDNLRTLSLLFGCLSKRDVHKLQALGTFLQKSLNLEKLTLDYFLYSGSFKRLEQKENMSRLKGARPVVGTEFPVLKKLRTLIMYGYDLCDDFQLLRHCLRHSPNLEKLVIECCKLPEASAGGKGKTKLKEAYSQFQITPRFKCLKLKSTEIKYEDGNNVGELVNFLVGVSGGSSKNIIKLTMVEDDLTDDEDDEVADLPA
ncbi:hypothetical protein EJB05_37859 [Eragrostis curvula]|uniref:FBD domain-containing protein n=1 Tax=Eragrostis curvula TaxID=38414 RepID=A0A5J9TSS1_9POAL|nr:hypothetical protein EJB05_37859 [Eragrostis curvula]